jgi:hypothetical protein
MHRFRDALNGPDLAHLREILGERQDPTFNETRRRSRVNQIATDATFLADDAVAPFQALSQEDRERLISDVVWQVTCYVEGSITRRLGKRIPLELDFRLVELERDGKTLFCVEKRNE